MPFFQDYPHHMDLRGSSGGSSSHGSFGFKTPDSLYAQQQLHQHQQQQLAAGHHPMLSSLSPFYQVRERNNGRLIEHTNSQVSNFQGQQSQNTGHGHGQQSATADYSNLHHGYNGYGHSAAAAAAAGQNGGQSSADVKPESKNMLTDFFGKMMNFR